MCAVPSVVAVNVYQTLLLAEGLVGPTPQATPTALSSGPTVASVVSTGALVYGSVIGVAPSNVSLAGAAAHDVPGPAASANTPVTTASRPTGRRRTCSDCPCPVPSKPLSG